MRPFARLRQEKLFSMREKRVRPGRDEKVLVSWNALMIAGMARAAVVFGRADWLDSAKKALAFVRRAMWKNERLLATYKDGKAHLNAYLDDYAFLLAALIELLQAEFDREILAFAEELAEVLLEQFEDRENGGFFFTSHDHERLIHRPKPGYDNATPSGNGAAAFALQTPAFSYRRAPLRERSRAYPGAVSVGDKRSAGRPCDAARGPRGTSGSHAHGDPARPERELPRWRNRARATLSSAIRGDRGRNRSPGPAAGARQARGRQGQRLGVRRRYLPCAYRSPGRPDRTGFQAGENPVAWREIFSHPRRIDETLALSAAAVFAASITAASGPLLAADAQQLLKEKACLSCHTVDKKLIGPAVQ